MCWRDLRRPWRSMWVLRGFFYRDGVSLESLGITGTLSRSGLLAAGCHAQTCEWRAVYASIMSPL